MLESLLCLPANTEAVGTPYENLRKSCVTWHARLPAPSHDHQVCKAALLIKHHMLTNGRGDTSVSLLRVVRATNKEGHVASQRSLSERWQGFLAASLLCCHHRYHR